MNILTVNEWTKEMWYIYTMEYYSAIKMNEWNNAIFGNLDATRDYYAKASQAEKDKCNMISLTCEI